MKLDSPYQYFSSFQHFLSAIDYYPQAITRNHKLLYLITNL